MNFCDPLMKILKSDKMKSVPRNGYEINFVICEAHEICQPLSSKGDLAEIGYSFLNLLKDSYRNGRNTPTLTFENLKPLEISLVLLLISNLTNGLRLHQFLRTKTSETNKSLKYDFIEIDMIQTSSLNSNTIK